MEDKFRVTNVGYLNSVPYRALSLLDWVDYDECEPAECARKLHEDETDLACIPLAEYANFGSYRCFPFGIAATGPVESVFVFSAEPLEQLERIYVDKSSITSINLFRILIAKYFPELAGKLCYARIHRDQAVARIGNKSGALVIGDKAFSLRGQFPYQYDLARLWFDFTKQPFVFAVWAGRTDRLSGQQIEALRKCLAFGVAEKQIYAREWAEEHHYDREAAVAYIIGNITHELDAGVLEGAKTFLRFGDEAGLFPHSELRFILPGGVRPIHDSEFEALTEEGSGNGYSKSAAVHYRWHGIDGLLQKGSEGKRLSVAEALTLAEQATMGDLALAADARRKMLHPDEGVSYIVDRNINYTNVCNVYCRFCAFYRAPGNAEGYVLSREEIGRKIQETLDSGGIQILLQGGLNPELGIAYYEDLFRWIKQHYPINVHGLSSDEIWHISRVSHISIEEVLKRLIDAGLGSLPGGGAEILVDRIRRRIARLKTTADEWLEVHRAAHRLGITSTCTMMFGVHETWLDRILHLQKLRQLQDETRGFTAFIAWSFQEENTKLERSDTSAPEYLRVQAISRLFLDNFSNIQSSWVTQGPSIGQVGLSFGANDFGSVMFEENVVSAAGATFHLDEQTIERHIREAGFHPWKRDVHYQKVA